MGEESHLDEMRSAIRGDFERLAERRGDQNLLRVAEDEPPLDAIMSESEDDEVVERRSWFARLVSP